ncbi:ubiquitin-related domain-containing protein [Lactarius akahatsu]|uniref:Ubiquitin-related domain-containing protein n=1 Tax=Lactarius akahatsu TaxID=416441 RepID=A0AAD4LDT8_9AGAM|nr:ubiquitin-related domain-containing protein [Lactarius akahatsu]
MVLIFVEYQWETSLVFDIALSEAVGTLKAQIQAIIGKPIGTNDKGDVFNFLLILSSYHIARQRLQHIDEDSICKLLHRYHSPELEDKMNLEFYGISEGTILFLSDRPLSPIVFVITLTGRTLRCDMALDWDVLMLKRVIEKKEGIPPHLQRLIYRGRQLNDSLTLSSYGIQEEDVIYLVFRLSGGAPMRSPGICACYCVV